MDEVIRQHVKNIFAENKNLNVVYATEKGHVFISKQSRRSYLQEVGKKDKAVNISRKDVSKILKKNS